MMKSAARKLMWAGRATVFMMGLALTLALVFGMASTAFGANGGNFILGSLNNTATAITKLTGTVGGGPALRVSNPSTATDSTALDLRVATGQAPMKVNSGTKVTNLNADSIDGKDSTQFANGVGGKATDADKLDGFDSTDIGRQRWAVISADGTIARSNGADADFTTRLGTGHYLVVFDAFVANCAYVATTTGGFAGQTGVLHTANDFLTDVQVFTTSSSGTPADLPFHLIVTC